MGLNHLTAVASALLTIQLDSSVADVVSFDWRVTNIYTEYDGVFINSIGINDKPADQAVIDVELGQEVEVRVTNELTDPTCLHWHGMKQLGTQEMDGTSEITQCHIPTNATAVYHFTPDKAGSFWWHSHHLAQYAFGLRGPMVVRAPRNQMKDWEKDIYGEYIIQLADMYHRRPVAVPIYNSILINNRGRYNCTAAAKQNFTDCTDVQPLPKFHFEPGKKYRLRLISMVALAPIDFSIDEHKFRVVAADADYVKPSKSLNSIMINAGQRYDIIVKAKSDKDRRNNKSYWMRAKGRHGTPWTAGTAEMAGEGFNDEGLAIVSYEDDEAEPTTSKHDKIKTMPEFDYKPEIVVQLPEVPDHRSIIQFQMQNGLGWFEDRATSCRRQCYKNRLWQTY
ncbi:hypothetical protein L916_07850 [Plasmopara halstedii]|uniref:Multicopper oxidase n=1 Tax=Plasmopara halstedii TaxID=4781 RepID=A0A0P1AP36_PLAHL|nr:hypothetical protein L916_07850 [Plasmopara halstedii]CEG42954.1 hypothetical protein L916_07850 [Plasmopara halstedii]|eukprot:XP_024579323.1 hypothetical protein L916_07850 [Plasmopara halstedii]